MGDGDRTGEAGQNDDETDEQHQPLIGPSLSGLPSQASSPFVTGALRSASVLRLLLVGQEA
ncbi:hypothetical protein GCM10029963_47340 [Micromonospora andamanensis]|nr:hypothetical protein Vwe01_52120 [Micromonospora andamanensis]